MPDDKYFKKEYGYGSRDNPGTSAITGSLTFFGLGLIGNDDATSQAAPQVHPNYQIPTPRINGRDKTSNQRRAQGYRGL